MQHSSSKLIIPRALSSFHLTSRRILATFLLPRLLLLPLLLFLLSGGLTDSARAQSSPVLPPLEFYPQEQGGVGKWHLHGPTIPGWHYSVEQMNPDQTWSPAPDGQFYGNGQPFQYFVTNGPLPAPPGGGPPPPSSPSWQLRWLRFQIEQQKNALGSSFRIRRDATTIPPNNTPLAAWDAVLTEPLPPMPVGTRYFVFQGWDDSATRTMWQTDFTLTTTEGPPPAESLPATPNRPPNSTSSSRSKPSSSAA